MSEVPIKTNTSMAKGSKEKVEFQEFSLYGGKIQGKFYPVSHAYYINGVRKTGVTTIGNIKDKSQALVPWALEEAAKSLLGVLDRKRDINADDIIKAVFASDLARDTAATLGSAIHDWIEQYIRAKLKKGGMPLMPTDKQVLTGVTSFLEWESQHKVKFLWAEKVVYSRKHDYIGKADFGAIIDGDRCLCDNKTSNGLYNGVRMQTAAYVKADEEETKEKYDGRWAIRIAKETEEEYLKRMEHKNRIKAILGKKEVEIKPYQVFEAKFLDASASDIETDFQAFLDAKGLMTWDRLTAYL